MTKMTKWKIILPGSEIDLSGTNHKQWRQFVTDTNEIRLKKQYSIIFTVVIHR